MGLSDGVKERKIKTEERPKKMMGGTQLSTSLYDLILFFLPTPCFLTLSFPPFSSPTFPAPPLSDQSK